ncbi:Threonine dehydrogenase [Marinobacterium lacunae]|uniref:Threonine dehydrogenase n=1 Tax=Marinobacterium lacunae TaxID=1232683 RepID=A0A081G2Q1_9GAMM|nr:2,3-butanediol dehydrogenase [Marinobacterium lacunae]KEA65056.1 Threonine dehydrogenase [Marinobacterium lacunae]
MKVLRWYGAQDIRLSDVPNAVHKDNEVLVQVAYCGICGSDLHEYQDGPHAIPCGAMHPVSGHQAPLTLGHEFCGQVVAVGDQVSTVKVGDRVAIEPEYRCQTCRYCKSGDYNLCESMGFIGLMGDGGMAEQVAVPEYMLHRLPDTVSYRQAAVLEPSAVAEHALNRSALKPGSRCLVIGLGPIGLLLIMLARLRGITDICAVDISPERLHKAQQLGAQHTLDGRQPDLLMQLQQLSDGGYDSVFEAAGSQTTFTTALQAAKKGGEVLLVGLMGDISLDAFDLVNREVRLQTSVGYRNVYPTLISHIAEGAFDPSVIVTRTVGLENALSAGFDALLSSKEQIKVLINPNPSLNEQEHQFHV